MPVPITLLPPALSLSPLEVKVLPPLVEEWVALLLALVLRLFDVLATIKPSPFLLVRQHLVSLMGGEE